MALLLSGDVVIENLPADAEVVGVHQITLFQTVELVIASESFAPLSPGMMIPRETVCFRRIDPQAKELLRCLVTAPSQI